jgi:DNA excision repair protein ERCC-2
MEHILKHWKQSGLMDDLINTKYIFIEKKDPTETEESLRNYRKACDIGRGGIFLAIARGKIAEGIDF